MPAAPEPAEPAYLVSPVQRAMRLLQYLVDGGSTASLSEAARGLDINRATLSRLLDTLEHEGILERQPGVGHRLGLRFLGMAASALSSRDLPQLAGPILDGLAARLGLSAYLTVPQGGQVLYLLRAVPDTPLVSHIRLGSQVPAHQTAPGRSLLASRSPEQRRALLGADPLPAATARSPGTHAALDAVLAEDAARGCAWSFSGLEAGVNACAAATAGGTAAISVAGPAAAFVDDAAVEAAVKHAAAELSRLLGERRGSARGP
jgi:DNA-binding IclR family transcriptional regulator